MSQHIPRAWVSPTGIPSHRGTDLQQISSCLTYLGCRISVPWGQWQPFCFPGSLPDSSWFLPRDWCHHTCLECWEWQCLQGRCCSGPPQPRHTEGRGREKRSSVSILSALQCKAVCVCVCVCSGVSYEGCDWPTATSFCKKLNLGQSCSGPNAFGHRSEMGEI